AKTRKAVGAIKWSGIDYGPLINASKVGELTDEVVLKAVEDWQVDDRYKKGVQKVREALAAIQRTVDAQATLQTVDQAEMLRNLRAGNVYFDGQGQPIQLKDSDELYGAKKVPEGCWNIAFTD